MATEYGDGLPAEPARPNPVWKVAMVGVPAFLLLSTGFALWIWWKKSQDDSVDPRLALSNEAAGVPRPCLSSSDQLETDGSTAVPFGSRVVFSRCWQKPSSKTVKKKGT